MPDTTTQEERRAITERVLRGLRHERYGKDGEAAYAEAVASFTPHQLGALHRRMREADSDLYEKEMRASCGGW